MESDQSPQLKGVVIITLPPEDNPSFGKTITAFTVSDSTPITSQPNQQDQVPSHHHQQTLPQPPSESSPSPEPQFSFRGSIANNSPRLVLGVLGVSFLALFLLASFVSQQTLFKTRSSNDDHKPNSFVFPLYYKLGVAKQSQTDVELKLGRLTEFNYSGSVLEAPLVVDRMRDSKITKSFSTKSEIDSTAISPVKGNIYPDGLYYTYVLVGSPPKPYFLDMDTGSDLTWIQCDAPCASCAKGAHPFYKPKKRNIVPSKDSLCVEVQRTRGTEYCETCQCDYEIEYADHSSSVGILARDELHLMIPNGSFVKRDVVFGCAYDQQGLLLNSLTKTDGILGLSRAKVSLPSQLASHGIINNVVGHCLSNVAGGGGYMFLGDDFVPYWQMAWVSMLYSPSPFYQSEVVKMNYGSKQLTLGDQKNGLGLIVFDSGSSYTYFSRKVYSDLVATLKDISSEDLILDSSDPTLPICWRAKFPIRSVMDVKQFFKPLTIHFGSNWWIVSTKLRIPQEGYLIINNKGNVCLGILDGSEVHDGSTIILGDISLRGLLVVFDNVNQKIGWMQSDCVKPWRFRNHPFI